MPILLAATALLAYLAGSIPFGLLLTRSAGLGDIRAIGSGNIGATNVLRTGRRGLAAATLALDALKGLFAVLAARAAWPLLSDVRPAGPAGAAATLAAIATVAVVVGHCAPVWLRFRGGKGVATGLGALFGLDWRLGALACAAWLAAAVATRRSSAGALAAFVASPVLACLVDPAVAAWSAVAVAALVLARHHANIRRLLAGTEPRIGAR